MIKILDVQPDRDKKGYKILKLNNETEIAVSEESMFKYGLYLDAEFDSNEFDNIIFNIMTDEAYARALLFVQGRLRTEKETEFKLKQLGYTQTCIKKVIARLKERGYINDELYAERFIRTNIKLSRKSSRFIFYELLQKGVDEETVQKALDKFEIDDDRVALELLKKKFLPGSKNGDITPNDVIKMKRFLYNKGFEMDVINNAIENFTKYQEEVKF